MDKKKEFEEYCIKISSKVIYKVGTYYLSCIFLFDKFVREKSIHQRIER